MPTTLTHRVATEADIPGLVALMDLFITRRLAAFLTLDQITDPALLDESRVALDALTGLLGLGRFQQS